MVDADIDKMSLSQIERDHIIDVLMETNGNKSQAAQILCISLATLRNKIKEHGIYPLPENDDNYA